MEASTLRDTQKPPGSGYFYFYCNRNEWTERDRLILNLIQPHISQAYQSVRNFH